MTEAKANNEQKTRFQQTEQGDQSYTVMSVPQGSKFPVLVQIGLSSDLNPIQTFDCKPDLVTNINVGLHDVLVSESERFPAEASTCANMFCRKGRVGGTTLWGPQHFTFMASGLRCSAPLRCQGSLIRNTPRPCVLQEYRAARSLGSAGLLQGMFSLTKLVLPGLSPTLSLGYCNHRDFN